MVKVESDTGCYQLVIRIKKGSAIKIGALGRLHFARGLYIYTGRAARGLKKRVERHLRKRKRKHWHIDYLLKKGSIEKVFYYPGRLDECIINEEMLKKINGGSLVKGFGSSDCRCPGHLIFAGDKLIHD